MEIKDVVTIIALLLGPVIAVVITLWFQKRAEKRNAKLQLFITLMANRQGGPSREWVNALNLIDVVYAGESRVIQLWKELYFILNTQGFNQQTFWHKYLDLLSAMATSLGYRSLTQTDIDKFYMPQGLGDQAARSLETQIEWLRVLKASPALYKGGVGTTGVAGTTGTTQSPGPTPP
jgi:hypothetical protein